MVPRPEDLPEQCVAGVSSSWGISSKSASKLPLSSDGRHADTLMKTLLAMDTSMLVQALLGTPPHPNPPPLALHHELFHLSTFQWVSDNGGSVVDSVCFHISINIFLGRAWGGAGTLHTSK